MKNKVNELHVNGQNIEAFDISIPLIPDVILLKARWNTINKNYNMGLITHDEFLRSSSGIIYQHLCIIDEYEKNISTIKT